MFSLCYTPACRPRIDPITRESYILANGDMK